MAIADDVKQKISTLIDTEWKVVDGKVVPKTEDLVLKDGGRRLAATYLYADLADSSKLVRSFDKEVAASVIRSYISGASTIMRHYGGEIRSFDGDRVMAIFLGSSKNSNAVRAALAINWAVVHVMRPAMNAKWKKMSATWVLTHGIGIDSGESLVTRAGVRDHNDLVSVGRAPNIAAKLSAVRGHRALQISGDVYRSLNKTSKFGAKGQDMWTSRGTQEIGGYRLAVYESAYTWKP